MKQKKKLFVIFAVLILAIALITVAIITLSKGGNKEIQEKLDLGQNYLDELKYEQALASYMAVLDIDPNNAEAYMGIVEAYMGMDDTENALKYAKEGYEVTGDEKLEEMIKNLEAEQLAATPEKRLEQGWLLLDEMKYEEALECFEKILEQESENADAYLGIVEVYIRTTEFEKALEYAKKGYELTGDERLKEKIEMLEGEIIMDSSGRIMKEAWYYDGEFAGVWEYTYNQYGINCVDVYNAAGEHIDSLTCKYDEYGRCIEDAWYHYGDIRVNKVDIVYEENNVQIHTYYENDDITINNIKYAKFNDNGDIIYEKNKLFSEEREEYYTEFYYSYKYDSLGRILYMYRDENDDDEWRESYEYIYNDKEQVIKTNRYWWGELSQTYVYTYDENGGLISQVEYNADGTIESEIRTE